MTNFVSSGIERVYIQGAVMLAMLCTALALEFYLILEECFSREENADDIDLELFSNTTNYY
jgi:hypothetical protein